MFLLSSGGDAPSLALTRNDVLAMLPDERERAADWLRRQRDQFAEAVAGMRRRR